MFGQAASSLHAIHGAQNGDGSSLGCQLAHFESEQRLERAGIVQRGDRGDLVRRQVPGLTAALDVLFYSISSTPPEHGLAFRVGYCIEKRPKLLLARVIDRINPGDRRDLGFQLRDLDWLDGAQALIAGLVIASVDSLDELVATPVSVRSARCFVDALRIAPHAAEPARDRRDNESMRF